MAVEVSLQPWRAFKPDGVILFSDILTPLTGMNIPFDIMKAQGPVIHNPIRTAADVAQVRELVPDEAVPYVGQALTALRSEVSFFQEFCGGSLEVELEIFFSLYWRAYLECSS